MFKNNRGHSVMGTTAKMFSVRLVFILFCLKYVLCLQKKLCSNDEECLINAVIDRAYPRFVAGMPGVETSDPLRLDAFIADLPTLAYALFNATLTGLKDCEFFRLRNTRHGEYTALDYAMSCPVLTLQAEYDLNGILDSIPVEGKGTCKIVYEDYHILIRGKLVKILNDKGTYVNLFESTVTLELNGGVKDIEYKNLDDSDLEPLIYGDHREMIIEQITRDFVMDSFMKKYIQNLNNFHKQVPIEDLLFKYVS